MPFGTLLARQTQWYISSDLNGTRWKLRDEVIQRRSRVFWQLFVLDTCSVCLTPSLAPSVFNIILFGQSFCFGRPPGISPSYIDCSLPKEAITELNCASPPPCIQLVHKPITCSPYLELPVHDLVAVCHGYHPWASPAALLHRPRA